jgi:hypothetical protein
MSNVERLNEIVGKATRVKERISFHESHLGDPKYSQEHVQELLSKEQKKLEAYRNEYRTLRDNPPKVKREYYPIDYTWTDVTTGERKISTKKIVDTFIGEDGKQHYKWTPHTYEEIAQSIYKDKPVYTSKGFRPVKQIINDLRAYDNLIGNTADTVKRQTYVQAQIKLKKRLDTCLDALSRKQSKAVKDALYTPEYKVSLAKDYKVTKNIEPMLTTFFDDDEARQFFIKAESEGWDLIADQDPIVAYYPLLDNGENYYDVFRGKGDVGIVREAYIEHIQVGEDHGLYYEYHGAATNTAMKFEHTLKYTTPRVVPILQLAKVFNVNPDFRIMALPKVAGLLNKNLRGLALTESKLEELNVVVNHYVGLAEQGLDLSDPLTLHHTNGVDVLELTEYEYYKRLQDTTTRDEFIETYQRIECRDFLAPLHEDEEE